MTIVLIASALYLFAAYLLVRDVVRVEARRSRSWLLPAGLGALGHGMTHVLAWRSAG